MKIIKTSEALPKSGRYVLAWLQGAKIPMRAMWAAQHTLPLGDDADPEWGEYSEEKDEYFCPAGWYEMNQHEEQHWGVDGNVVAWCELPRLDHQCLAQIEEPAQPIAGYRISDPSDPTIEPWLSETPDDNGYTSEPLYAGAAPAAVAPQGDYPQLPDPDSYLFQHEETGLTQYVEAQQVEWGFEKNNPRWKKCEGVFSESQMHAYFDLGRQPVPAPALEAPAAKSGDLVAVPRDLIGSACAAIDKQRAAPKTLAELRRYTTGDLSCAALAAAPQAPNCTRCSGSGEDPEGYLTHGRGPDDHTVDGPCRGCDGTGAAPQAPAAPSIAVVTDEQIDAILDSPGGLGMVIADKRERMRMFARRVLDLAAPAAPVGLPWRTGIPPWTDDRSVRVIAVTAHDDFGGVQVHDIRASDFHTDGDGDGAEVARVCTHWAYRDDIWPRADAVAPAAPIPWDNFPAYLIDHCEGQTITEEGLQRALSAMLANPQYAGAAPAAPAVDAALNALIDDVRALPTMRASEIDGEESDGTPKHWRNRPFVSLRKLEVLLRDRVTASNDTALLNFIAAEYLDLRSFSMPTGQGDADVGWRVIQHHMGEPTERVVSEVYKDDPRSAIRAAIARLERDPYCTGALHEEDAAQAAAKGAA